MSIEHSFHEGRNLLLLHGDPLTPLLLLPKAPPAPCTKSQAFGVVFLLLAVWMALEGDESVSRGPANTLARVADLDREDVASIGSSLLGFVACLLLLSGVYRYILMVHDQQKWAEKAERGISMARRFHQNRMHRLWERQGLQDLSLIHVVPSFSGSTNAEELQSRKRRPENHATNAKEGAMEEER